MEITLNEFENLSATGVAGSKHFSAQTFDLPGGEDDDDDSSAAGDDNPPVDDDVVHSPVTTQPGKPRRQ